MAERWRHSLHPVQPPKDRAMTTTLLAVSRGLLITAAVAASPLAQAYFVTPFVQNGASSSNGFEENGATQKSVNIGDIASASVDLADGTIRNFLEVTGPACSASGPASWAIG
ncbi:MAG: hypothetical protein Q8N44_13795 [Rubrivivax sp.]|nr:hypothetical protein [Rubrivivax sp.]